MTIQLNNYLKDTETKYFIPISDKLLPSTKGWPYASLLSADYIQEPEISSGKS